MNSGRLPPAWASEPHAPDRAITPHRRRLLPDGPRRARAGTSACLRRFGASAMLHVDPVGRASRGRDWDASGFHCGMARRLWGDDARILVRLMAGYRYTAAAQSGGRGSNITEILAALDRSTAWLGALRVASKSHERLAHDPGAALGQGLYSDGGSQTCSVHLLERKLGAMLAVDIAILD